MSRLFDDFIDGVLTGTHAIALTTMTSTGLVGLGAVASPDVVAVTLDPESAAGAPEIVHITSHAGAGGTATILRAQEGTVAREHASGVAWRHAFTTVDANASQVPAGTVFDYLGTVAPTGYVLHGATFSRDTDLFDLIGTTFGIGDGSTTADAPDFSDLSLVATGGTIGALTGTTTVTLAETNIPAHVHAAGTLAVADHASHGHTSTVAVDAHGNHSHSSTIAVANHPSHTHAGSSLSTDTEASVAVEVRNASSVRTIVSEGESSGYGLASGGAFNNRALIASNFTSAGARATATVPAHAHTITGNTGGTSSTQTHSVTGSVSDASAGSHTVTGSVSNATLDAHVVGGSTGSIGSTTAFNVVTPQMAVQKIIKL